MTTPAEEQLGDQPPSAKLVYKVLEYDGTMTKKEIIEASRLADRTVHSALKQLKECDIVEERIYLADPRHSLYELTDLAPAVEGNSATTQTTRTTGDD